MHSTCVEFHKNLLRSLGCRASKYVDTHRQVHNNAHQNKHVNVLKFGVVHGGIRANELAYQRVKDSVRKETIQVSLVTFDEIYSIIKVHSRKAWKLTHQNPTPQTLTT